VSGPHCLSSRSDGLSLNCHKNGLTSLAKINDREDMMKKISILIIEDEQAIRDMLVFSLSTQDFHTLVAENASQAMKLLADKVPNLIILDWMLPGKSGMDLLKWIRHHEVYKNIPIIMLTAKAEEENKIKALITGADDYVTKPFSPNELIARIKTILRRGLLTASSDEIKIDHLVINLNKCQIFIANEPLAVSPIEYKMLHFFVTHPNKTFTRDQLITHVRGGNIYIDERTIDVQIRRLRNKLKPFGYDKKIKTVRGVGYYFSREDHEKK
jgi:two-component system, OmpR family, phosphate regulon response regulator PhoB